MNEGAELRAFTAIGQALPGEAPMPREMRPGRTGWASAACDWLDSQRRADIYPLLDQLSFVTRPPALGHVFPQIAVQGFRGRDFALIADAMGVGDRQSRR